MESNYYIKDGWTRDELLDQRDTILEDLELLDAALARLPKEDEEDEDPYCTNCNGTGEGMYDGSSCGCCGGRGFIVNKDRYED